MVLDPPRCWFLRDYIYPLFETQAEQSQYHFQKTAGLQVIEVKVNEETHFYWFSLATTDTKW